MSMSRITAFRNILFGTLTCTTLVACEEGAVSTTSGAGAGLSQPVSTIALIAVRYKTRDTLPITNAIFICDQEMRIRFQGENAFVSTRLIGCNGDLNITPFTQPGPTAINQAVSREVTCTGSGEGGTECNDGSRIPGTEGFRVTDIRRTSQVNEQLLINSNQLTYQRDENGSSQSTNAPDAAFDPGKTVRFQFTWENQFSISFNGSSCSMDRYVRNTNVDGSPGSSILRSDQSCTITYQ